MSYKLHVDGVALHLESNATKEEEEACREMVRERLDEWCAEMSEALDELWAAQLRDRVRKEIQADRPELFEVLESICRPRLSMEQHKWQRESLERVRRDSERLYGVPTPESEKFLKGELKLDPADSIKASPLDKLIVEGFSPDHISVVEECCSNEKPHVPGGIWCRRGE